MFWKCKWKNRSFKVLNFFKILNYFRVKAIQIADTSNLSLKQIEMERQYLLKKNGKIISSKATEFKEKELIAIQSLIQAAKQFSLLSLFKEAGQCAYTANEPLIAANYFYKGNHLKEAGEM